jgi:hypothetical protein
VARDYQTEICAIDGPVRCQRGARNHTDTNTGAGADAGRHKGVAHEARGGNTNHEAPGERDPLSGKSRLREGHDVDVYPFDTDEGPLVAEVKSRRSGAGFVTLEKWLGEYDCLLRRNCAEPMLLLRWRVWAALLARVRR